MEKAILLPLKLSPSFQCKANMPQFFLKMNINRNVFVKRKYHIQNYLFNIETSILRKHIMTSFLS